MIRNCHKNSATKVLGASNRFLWLFFQERTHADASKQKAVRMQGGRMRQIVLRREESEEAYGESSCRQQGERKRQSQQSNHRSSYTEHTREQSQHAQHARCNVDNEWPRTSGFKATARHRTDSGATAKGKSPYISTDFIIIVMLIIIIIYHYYYYCYFSLTIVDFFYINSLQNFVQERKSVSRLQPFISTRKKFKS